MRKTIVLPTWRESPSEDLAEPNSAYATITHHHEHKRVLFSGGLAVEGEIGEQVRTILTHRQQALQDFGGSMDDVVMTQYFVRDEYLNRETQATIHEVRDEFFQRPHYPASTMVGTASLLAADALVEIELEAEIPHNEWDTTIQTEKDL